MTSWKRDFASGLVVLGPILVTLFVLYWLYGFVSSLTPGFFLPTQLLEGIIADASVREGIAELLRVLVSLTVLIILIFAVGYLMRTTFGTLVERILDGLANRLPGLRVVYNASKMAAETAFGEQDSLQEPVKVEVWEGLRMTAFRTGKTADDDREVLFLPTSPNITTGFVIEARTEDIEDIDEDVEDALTRVLSAGFGDADRSRGMGSGIAIDVLDESAGETGADAGAETGSGQRTGSGQGPGAEDD